VHKVWVDQGYRGEKVLEAAKVAGSEIEVVQRQERGFQLLPRRWGVERTFTWLSQNRRLSRDYEELAQTSEGWVYLGTVGLMLRRLTA
jgi:putative transposase